MCTVADLAYVVLPTVTEITTIIGCVHSLTL